MNVYELRDALLRAEAAHAVYEKTLGHTDSNWAEWYAQYILVEEDKNG